MNANAIYITVSQRQILNANESRKRPLNPHLWKDEQAKRRRNSGEPYMSRGNDAKAGKVAPDVVMSKNINNTIQILKVSILGKNLH
jgi:hypothetical protein